MSRLDDDLERASFDFSHPEQGAPGRVIGGFLVLTVLALGGASAAVLYSGTSWFQPLPPEAVLLDCKKHRQLCELQLPQAVREVPSFQQVRTAARTRFLTAMVSHRWAPHYEDQAAWRADLAREAPELGPHTEEQLEAMILGGMQVDAGVTPSLPRGDLGRWMHAKANDDSRQEAERFGRASSRTRKRLLRELEQEREDAVAVYQRAHRGRQAGIGGVILGLISVVFGGLTVLLARRARALQPFRVELTRHQLIIRDERFPLSAMKPADVDRVVRLLEAEGHLCGRVDAFREALGARIDALQQGQVDPQARRALERLLQRG